MSKCAKCGFNNPDSNNFCQNCGVPLVARAPAPSVTVDIPRSDTLTSSVEELATPVDTSSAPKEAAWLGVLSQWMGAPVDILSVLEEEGTLLEKNEVEALLEENAPLEENKENAPLEENKENAPLEENKENAPLEENEVNKPTAPKMPLSTEKRVLLAGFKYAGLTDVGSQRDHNEDAFAIRSQVMTVEGSNEDTIQTSRGLFVLCDGMGGHAGGEVASALAIAHIKEGFQLFWANTLPGENELREIIDAANQAIYDLNERELRRDSGRMGTTLVLLALYNSEIAIAHVGDSRIYQITSSKLEQVTRDHEVFNRLIDRGVDAEIAKARPDARQLTQALGPGANFQINPSIQFFQLSEPTLFLLCSDGLCDNDVVEQNWQSHLLPLLSPEADLKKGVKDLIDLGNSLNGHDNITAILIHCQVEVAEQ